MNKKTYSLSILQEYITHPLRVKGKELRVEKQVAGVLQLKGRLEVLLCKSLGPSVHRMLGRTTHHDSTRRMR